MLCSLRRTILARVLGALLAAMTVFAAAPPAQAQTPVSAERKEELNAQFKTAVEDYKAKRYTEALPQFREVARELDSPNALLYVARCLREMGRFTEAFDVMLQTERDAAAKAVHESRFKGTAEAAKEERLALHPHIGRLTVSVPNAPGGTVVEVAGRSVPVDRVISVTPGPVSVEVRAPDHQPVRRKLDVPAGTHEHISVQIVAPAPRPGAPAPAVAPQPPSPSPAPTPATSGGGIRLAGYGVLGLGVLGWTALIVGGVVSDNKFASVEEACGGARCTTDTQQDLIDEGRNYELAANIGIGLGAAGTVAGVLMILFGGPTENAAAAPPPVSLSVGPDGGLLRFSAEF